LFVVHQDIDPAELALASLDHAIDFGRSGQISGNRKKPLPVDRRIGGEFVNERLQLAGAAGDQREAGALVEEFHCDRVSQPARGAGEQDSFM
jgi:hypothetical protein